MDPQSLHAGLVDKAAQIVLADTVGVLYLVPDLSEQVLKVILFDLIRYQDPDLYHVSVIQTRVGPTALAVHQSSSQALIFSSSGTEVPSLNSGGASGSFSSMRQMPGCALIWKYFLPIAS